MDRLNQLQEAWNRATWNLMDLAASIKRDSLKFEQALLEAAEKEKNAEKEFKAELERQSAQHQA